MKKQSTVLLASLAYTYLLYQQGAGVNVLLLNLILLTILYLQNRVIIKEPINLLFAFGALFSSVFVAIHGHFLSVFANIISLGFLSVNLSLKRSSMASLFIHGIYAYLTTNINRLVQKGFTKTTSEESANESNEKPKANKWIIGISSIIVFTIFISLYRYSSANFNQFVLNLNFDFISFPFIFFFLTGLYLMSILIKPMVLKPLEENEINQKLHLSFSTFKEYKILGSTLQEITENGLAKVLFIGLNLMLLLVNILDTEFLITGKLPEGVNYSEYLHQGISSLILSIICAIAIILWFFRGSQNFSSSNQIKNLSYVWIALNCWMILSAAYRNHLYIMDHSLFTYKRIGVYMFLFCSLIGLALTYYKLANKRSNYFLLKTNSFAWYLILILSVVINWDRFIASNHIEACKERNEYPDIVYLSKLSYQAYPKTIEFLTESIQRNSENIEYDPNYEVEHLEYLVERLVSKEMNYTWKSYNYARCKGYSEINTSLKRAKITQLTNCLEAQHNIRTIAIFSEHRNPFNF
jgi:hypothetical protein